MVKSTITVAVVAIIAIVGIGLLVVRTERAPAGPVLPGTPVDGITVTVVANGVQDLAGVQFDLTYDPAVVRYVGATEGPFLDNGEKDAAMLLDTTTQENGVVKNIILLRVRQPGAAGTGTLASVQFERLGPGAPGIMLANVLVSDSKGQSLSADSISLVTQ